MDEIYITGHRNPDTDSIVSAMAYAALKNALGQRQYQRRGWGRSATRQNRPEPLWLPAAPPDPERAHPGP